MRPLLLVWTGLLFAACSAAPELHEEIDPPDVPHGFEESDLSFPQCEECAAVNVQAGEFCAQYYAACEEAPNCLRAIDCVLRCEDAWPSQEDPPAHCLQQCEWMFPEFTSLVAPYFRCICCITCDVECDAACVLRDGLFSEVLTCE